MILKRIYSFLISGLMWVYAYKCCIKSRIISSEETARLVIENKKSVIRFGDGEFFLLNGNSIHFQSHSRELANYLYNIVNDYRSNKNLYLLCMPKHYFECKGIEIMKNRVVFRSWVRPRFMFKKMYDKESIEYGDAFLFAEKNRKIYEKIWNRNTIKTVIFVHNNQIYADRFSNIYGKTVYFLKVPSENAFEKVDAIMDDILKLYYKYNSDIVLISAGPCAKILVWNLSKKGIWAIDTGHCWDDPIT